LVVGKIRRNVAHAGIEYFGVEELHLLEAAAEGGGKGRGRALHREYLRNSGVVADGKVIYP
jgi:hypothetical protein